MRSRKSSKYCILDSFDKVSLQCALNGSHSTTVDISTTRSSFQQYSLRNTHTNLIRATSKHKPIFRPVFKIQQSMKVQLPFNEMRRDIAKAVLTFFNWFWTLPKRAGSVFLPNTQCTARLYKKEHLIHTILFLAKHPILSTGSSTCHTCSVSVSLNPTQKSPEIKL